MSKYKLGDRVRIINGIGTLQDAMRGRIGTVARLRVANGVEYCHILIDGFDNPHEDDPTIMFHYNQLELWQGDSEYNKDIAISRYIRYRNHLKHKENLKYSKYFSAEKRLENLNYLSTTSIEHSDIPEIKSVIYSDPATIVFWKDGTKTVVKCKNEKFDPEKGLAMAFSKKMFGNKGNYYNIFKKWLPEEKPSNSSIPLSREIRDVFSCKRKKSEDKCRDCIYGNDLRDWLLCAFCENENKWRPKK